jgi:hypothetical protein
MKPLLLFTLLLSFFTGSAQQKDKWIYFKFTSKTLKPGARVCTLYTTDTIPRSTTFSAPGDYVAVYYSGDVPLLIYQEGCLVFDKTPWPNPHITVDKIVCPGDRIEVDMDNPKSVHKVLTAQ